MWEIRVETQSGKITEYDESSISEDGISISYETSKSDTFSIGLCVCKEAEIKLIDRKSDLFDLHYAEVVIKKDNRIYGKFICNEPDRQNGILTLSCYDHMLYLNREINRLIAGRSFGSVVTAICDACSLPLGTTRFHGYDLPCNLGNTEGMTYRELLEYIAQATCNYAMIDKDGNLILKWYNTDLGSIVSGGIFDEDCPYSSGPDIDGGDFTYISSDVLNGGTFTEMSDYRYVRNVFTLNNSTSEISITGIEVKNESASYLFGEEGYVLQIEKNPLTEGNERFYAEYIGSRTIGLTFRQFKASIQEDADIVAGEAVYYIDEDQNGYMSFITKVTYRINGDTTIECGAKSPMRQEFRGSSTITKILSMADRNTEKRIKTYDDTAKEITNLISEGYGLYQTNEEQEDGSIIAYLHNKPSKEESDVIWKRTSNGLMVSKNGGTTWAVDTNGNALFNVITARGINADWINAGTMHADRISGGTLTLGGMDNISGNITVKDETGKQIASLGKEGIDATKGNIGGWKMNATALYKDIVDQSYSNIIYRVWFQPPQNSVSPEKTWVLSCQKSEDEGKTFSGIFVLYADGSAMLGGGKTLLKADGSAVFGGGTLRINADSTLDVTTYTGAKRRGFTGAVPIEGNTHFYANGLYTGMVVGTYTEDPR